MTQKNNKNNPKPVHINPTVLLNNYTVRGQISKHRYILAYKLPIYLKKTKQFLLSGKIIWWLLGAGLLVLPVLQFNLQNLEQYRTSTLEKIKTNKILTVAMNDNEVFVDDTHIHGFGYDSAERYAKALNARLNVISYPSDQEAVNAVKAGKADMYVGVAQTDGTLTYSEIGCQKVDLSGYGIAADIGFGFNPSDQNLYDHAHQYLCDNDAVASTAKMAKFYQVDLLDNYSEKHFNRAIKERLPLYQHAFKTQAKKYDHDWQLLVAISYQESHLDPDSTSFTGVQGLMMLTSDTAKELGVTDRTDPAQSIQGGAKYLQRLKKRFDDIPESERLWFVLAAYNMGPNAVRNIQKELSAQGKDKNSWREFYAYLSDNAKSNSRYTQCMHYVTNIRHYLEVLKSSKEKSDKSAVVVKTASPNTEASTLNP